MKTIYKAKALFFGLLAGICLFNSCVDEIKVFDNFLEKAPGVDVNIDTIFSKGENAMQFLWTLYNRINRPCSYSALATYVPTESLSDIMHCYMEGWGGIPVTYYTGTLNESDQEGGGNDKFPFNDGGNRKGIWSALRKGWILVENLDRVPDLSENQKSMLKGEAYVIMATRYFDAFRNFGGLPLIDHAYAELEPYEGGRATAAETVTFIDSLIQKAINEPGLPWRLADNDIANWSGRLTKGAAYALRAKLYNFAASPLFNDDKPYRLYDKTEGETNIYHVWYGQKDNEYWNKCLQACQDFFVQNELNGNYYALVQPQSADLNGYRQAFREAYWTRGNSEKIIQVNLYNETPEWGWAASNYNELGQQGTIVPTLEYMEMFPMADGKNYPYKNIYYVAQSSPESPQDSVNIKANNPGNIDIFANRDPRLYETILVSQQNPIEQYLTLGSIEAWKRGNIYGQNAVSGRPAAHYSSMSIYKFVLDYVKTKNVPQSYSYIRMADMHLMYAEALAETGDLFGACREINTVRNRVGLGDIQTMNPELNLTSNKDNLINEILRERACEFGLEDERLYDIIRRKLTDRFSSPLHELHQWRRTAEGYKDSRESTSLKAGEPWPVNFIYEKRMIGVNKRSWWSENGWDNKWLISPMPRSEINKLYGLTQNPGW